MGDLMFRVRAVSTGWNGAPGLNTFYFSVPTEVPEIDKASLCVARVHVAFTAARNIYPSQWSCQVNNQVDVIDSEDGALTDTLFPDPVAVVTGLSGAGYGPLPAMLLLQLRTTTINDGSRLMGRAFLGPTGAGNDIDGSPHVGAVPLAVAFGEELLDAGLLTNPHLLVWRRPREADETRKTPSARSARAGMAAEVTSITVPDRFAVLTSRRD